MDVEAGGIQCDRFPRHRVVLVILEGDDDRHCCFTVGRNRRGGRQQGATAVGGADRGGNLKIDRAVGQGGNAIIGRCAHLDRTRGSAQLQGHARDAIGIAKRRQIVGLAVEQGAAAEDFKGDQLVGHRFVGAVQGAHAERIDEKFADRSGEAIALQINHFRGRRLASGGKKLHRCIAQRRTIELGAGLKAVDRIPIIGADGGHCAGDPGVAGLTGHAGGAAKIRAGRDRLKNNAVIGDRHSVGIGDHHGERFWQGLVDRSGLVVAADIGERIGVAGAGRGVKNQRRGIGRNFLAEVLRRDRHLVDKIAGAESEHHRGLPRGIGLDRGQGEAIDSATAAADQKLYRLAGNGIAERVADGHDQRLRQGCPEGALLIVTRDLVEQGRTASLCDGRKGDRGADESGTARRDAVGTGC